MKNTPLFGFALSLALPISNAFAQDSDSYEPRAPEDCDYVTAETPDIAIPFSDYSLEMFSIRTGCLLRLRDAGAVDPQIYRETIRAFQGHMAALAVGRSITLFDNYDTPDGIIAENFVQDYATLSYYEQYPGAFYKREDFFYDPRTEESQYLKRFSAQLQVMNPEVFSKTQDALYESWDDVKVLEQDLHPLQTPVNQRLTA